MAQRRQFFEFLQGDAERILDQARHTHDEGGIRVSGAGWMCTRGRASSSVHPQSSSHPLPPALCPVMLVCVYVYVCYVHAPQLHEWAEMKLRALRDEWSEQGLIPQERFQDFRKHLIGAPD